VVTGGYGVRGGLDDALEKLARRDELRRRAEGQAAGTPPAVTELVEAVAAVVARNPELAITMGVEGAGDPILLTFALDDGIVQVSADNPLSARASGPQAASPRHADFDLDPIVEPDEIFADEEPRRSEPARHADGSATAGDEDDVFAEQATGPAAPSLHDLESPTTRLRYGPDVESSLRDGDPAYRDTLSYEKKFGSAETYEAPPVYEPHPYEAYLASAEADRFTLPEEPARSDPAPYAAPPQVPAQSRAPEDAAGQPRPLPTPIPLRVEPEVTELAAKRLAALLREDPSLLQPHPHD
jgi:hypothetical protein